MKKVRSEELGVRSSGCCAWHLFNRRLAPRREVSEMVFYFYSHMSRAPSQPPTSAALPKESPKRKAAKVKERPFYIDATPPGRLCRKETFPISPTVRRLNGKHLPGPHPKVITEKLPPMPLQAQHRYSSPPLVEWR